MPSFARCIVPRGTVFCTVLVRCKVCAARFCTVLVRCSTWNSAKSGNFCAFALYWCGVALYWCVWAGTRMVMRMRMRMIRIRIEKFDSGSNSYSRNYFSTQFFSTFRNFFPQKFSVQVNFFRRNFQYIPNFFSQKFCAQRGEVNSLGSDGYLTRSAALCCTTQCSTCIEGMGD